MSSTQTELICEEAGVLIAELHSVLDGIGEGVDSGMC